MGATDRGFILGVESKAIELIRSGSGKRKILSLPMDFGSYRKMLVHRLCDYYGLARIVEERVGKIFYSIKRC